LMRATTTLALTHSDGATACSPIPIRCPRRITSTTGTPSGTGVWASRLPRGLRTRREPCVGNSRTARWSTIRWGTRP
jgi:hypothetical protein